MRVFLLSFLEWLLLGSFIEYDIKWWFLCIFILIFNMVVLLCGCKIKKFNVDKNDYIVLNI